MKIGDLVKTTGFGPNYSVGELGVLVKEYGRAMKCWVVFFTHSTQVVTEPELEVVNENR
jgi:hypothetical protein